MAADRGGSPRHRGRHLGGGRGIRRSEALTSRARTPSPDVPPSPAATDVRRKPAALPAQALRVLLGLAAAGAIAAYLAVAFRRAGYPFQLEWLDGGAVEHVRRVLQVRPIYTAASFDFVPYPYSPLHFWLSSLLARLPA